jgi:hypothetical protein
VAAYVCSVLGGAALAAGGGPAAVPAVAPPAGVGDLASPVPAPAWAAIPLRPAARGRAAGRPGPLEGAARELVDVLTWALGGYRADAEAALAAAFPGLRPGTAGQAGAPLT